MSIHEPFPNEILVIILSHVQDIRTKLRLESVSKSFRELVRKHCWKNVTRLNVDVWVQEHSRAFGYRVNKEFYSRKNIPRVLSVYQSRGLWIRELNFGKEGYLTVGEPSPIIRALRSLKNVYFLDRITTLSVRGSFAKCPDISEYLKNFRFGVTQLDFQWPEKLPLRENYKLWSSIGHLVHLEDLRLSRSVTDRETVDNDLVKALRGKSLKHLQLPPMSSITGEGLADALRLCYGLEVIKFTFGRNFRWEDFIENMDPEFFENLKNVSVSGPENDENFVLALPELPTICPKLEFCSLNHGNVISPVTLSDFCTNFWGANRSSVFPRTVHLEIACHSENFVPDFFEFRNKLLPLSSKIQTSVCVNRTSDTMERKYEATLDSQVVKIAFILNP